ncbi:MAG: hypothetical protein JST75_09465 [Bacteroidetes bacterium]|nr:hypothetical protein [Bacteroidota bacterium]
MLHKISWEYFLTIASFLTILYYAAFIFIFYRNIFSKIRFVKFKSLLGKKHAQAVTDDEEQADYFFHRASSLSKIIKQQISQAVAKNSSKAEILFAIQSTLKNYHDLIGTAFEPAINNLVEDLSNKECSIYLSAEELGSIWKN